MNIDNLYISKINSKVLLFSILRRVLNLKRKYNLGKNEWILS